MMSRYLDDHIATEKHLWNSRFKTKNTSLENPDEKIHRIEINLRDVISQTLEGDIGKLPPHVFKKINERLQHAASKKATLDKGDFQSLIRLLEFSDLQELKDIITNKTLWKDFEPRFTHKENLIIKFDQLGELRNGIRHSRPVDEIARKEGEAAILWFELVAKK
jgi:hypothetical protein